jgi:DNA-binding transcriptional LysR family regulator
MDRIAAVNLNALDLNLLRVFDAVLRRRSVTAAGEEVGLSQAGVSNALARLRKLCSDPLFVRSPRGMDPTPFAKTIAEPVRQALGLIESTLSRPAAFDAATTERTFRLHMSDIGEMVFLPRLLERLQRAAPGVHIETRSTPQAEIEQALASGELDLAVGFLPGLRAPVRSQPLFRDAYVCMMRADHPSIGRTLPRKLFLEAAHALVSSIGAGHRVIEDTLLAHGLNRRIALRVPHFMVVPMILERTDLVVTVPERVASVFERMGRFKTLRPPVAIPRTDVRVHWHERYDQDAGNRWLRSILVELYADRARDSAPRGARASVPGPAGPASGRQAAGTRGSRARAT